MTITPYTSEGLYLVEVEDEDFVDYTMEKYGWEEDVNTFYFKGYFSMAVEALKDYNDFAYCSGRF